MNNTMNKNTIARGTLTLVAIIIQTCISFVWWRLFSDTNFFINLAILLIIWNAMLRAIFWQFPESKNISSPNKPAI